MNSTRTLMAMVGKISQTYSLTMSTNIQILMVMVLVTIMMLMTTMMDGRTAMKSCAVLGQTQKTHFHCRTTKTGTIYVTQWMMIVTTMVTRMPLKNPTIPTHTTAKNIQKIWTVILYPTEQIQIAMGMVGLTKMSWIVVVMTIYQLLSQMIWMGILSAMN